jgi:hypothetical protein
VRPGFIVARAVGETIAIRLGLVQRTACGKEPRFARRRLHHPEYSEARRLMLSFFVHAVTRPFARSRYFVGLPFSASAFSSSCLTPKASAGARAQNSRSACRLRVRQVVSVSVSPGGAWRAWRHAHGDRRGADRCWMLDAGNSKWGAGNLQTVAPSGSFASAGTHTSSLLRTASSRSADHPIATG